MMIAMTLFSVGAYNFILRLYNSDTTYNNLLQLPSQKTFELLNRKCHTTSFLFFLCCFSHPALVVLGIREFLYVPQCNIIKTR